MPPVSACITTTSLLDMTINLQLIYKKSPGRSDPDFRGNKLQSQMQDWSWLRTDSEQIYIRSDREHFGLCEITTHCFFLLCLLSCLYFFYVSGTILGLTFLDSDTIVNFLLRFICRQRHLLSCCRLSIGECWLLDFFPFRHRLSRDQFRLSREQYRALEISIAPSLCRASYRLTVRGA